MMSAISTGLPHNQLSLFTAKSATFNRTSDLNESSTSPPPPVERKPIKIESQVLERATHSRLNFNFDDPYCTMKRGDMSYSGSYTSPEGDNIIGVLSHVPIDTPKVVGKISGQTAGGTQVSVSTIIPPKTGNDPKASGTYYYGLSMIGADGKEFQLDIKENVRVTQTKDGNAVFYESTNTTRVYAADGSYTELEGDIAGEDAEPIYVLVSTSSTLTTGNGNSTVLVCGNDVQVSTGNGDNTIFVYGNNAQITTGNGNDTVIAKHLNNAVIDLGGGNNTFEAEEVFDTQLSLGDGDNNITVGLVTGNSHISLGDGDNNISLEMMTGNGRISAGNGNNTVKGYSLGMPHEYTNTSITFGNGNNRVEFEDIRGGLISLGNGANFIELNRLLDNATLSVGNGNNVAKIYDVGGCGSESEPPSMGTLIFGDGNNRVQVMNSYFTSQMLFGNGNNTASIGQMQDKTNVSFGDGNNAMAGRSLLHNSSLSFGKGENYVFLDAMLGSPLLYLGAGTAFVKQQLHQSTVLNNSGSTYLGAATANPEQKKAESVLQQRFNTADFPMVLPDKLEQAFEKMYAA